jgi:hypothetical protein
MVTCDALELDPHVPWAALNTGKFVDKIAFWNERLFVLRLVRFSDPLRFEAFRFDRPDPFPK